MSDIKWVAIGAVVVCACLATSARSQSPTERNTAATPDSVQPSIDPNIVVFRDILVPMRDGTRLATDVYLPSRNSVVDPSARFPIVLVRTPYGKASAEPIGATSYLPKHGFAVVVQDVRGTNHSDGLFEPMLNESWGTR